MESDADDVLLQRFRHGDREAFTELVIRYRKPVYNAAFWVLKRPEDASDVTQMVFLRVVERLDDYDGQYKFFSWIYRIAINESLNLLRSRGRNDELPEEFDAVDADALSPEQQLDQAQRSRRLQECLMRLTVNDRVVLTLRHFSELGYGEIAEVLELEEKTVKSRLFEARGRLRAMLDDLRQA